MSGWFEVLGGIGMFLLGMALMTEGLRVVAGDAIRRGMARFTKGSVSGAFTGAIATGLIQSSGAVTVMAVGFVGAGLMTFQQSFGIILGANVGTTMTGWLVALLGMKLNLGLLSLPVLFIGALLRLFGRGRTAALGQTMAGFGMLFWGVAVLQSGMQQFTHLVTPEQFPPNTFWGRSQLFFLGVLVTLVTQSSSAGIATVLTALHGGHLSLAQAAALAVGMDVGTTSSAMLATVGGNVNARRTGLSHVLFNLMTGLFAFLLVPFYAHLWEAWMGVSTGQGSELGLVVFHSLFNLLGVITMLPFANRFVDFITWLIPGGERDLERRLEPTLLTNTHLALDSVLATLNDIAIVVLGELASLLRSRESPSVFMRALQQAEQATLKTSQYLESIRSQPSDASEAGRQRGAYHVVDHLRRLLVRSAKEDRLRTVVRDPTLISLCESLWKAIETTTHDGFTRESARRLESVWLELDRIAEPYRQETIETSIREGMTSRATLDRLDGIRWLRRLAYHAWRIVYHLAEAGVGADARKPATLLRQESDPIDE